jgi:hypothetical protein
VRGPTPGSASIVSKRPAAASRIDSVSAARNPKISWNASPLRLDRASAAAAHVPFAMSPTATVHLVTIDSTAFDAASMADATSISARLVTRSLSQS